jgi:L-fuconolactonase
MYGSDWPVCLVASSYEDALRIVKNYYASFSPADQQLIFSGNAKEFYQLQ